jgi:hypothetical protein
MSDGTLSRREWLKRGLQAGLAATLPVGCWSSTGNEKGRVPENTNLILISIDTLRADHLGCYGYNRPSSPALDRIASQSLLFEDVTTPAPWLPLFFRDISPYHQAECVGKSLWATASRTYQLFPTQRPQILPNVLKLNPYAGEG